MKYTDEGARLSTRTSVKKAEARAEWSCWIAVPLGCFFICVGYAQHRTLGKVLAENLHANR